MKVLKLLRKEYPELNLTLEWDERNHMVSLSGKETPETLLARGRIKEFVINNINVYISSINSPEIRYNHNTAGRFKELGLYIGGNPTNYPIFKTSRSDSSTTMLKQLFKSTQLNKQIKTL